ncbi:hypothetical protein [Carnobacterium maltaromaticum]|uniref:hypothetical protein n=1 Tax=Carnobacterium maltaromaticum TaxID=2751 RepID=UPI0012FA6060|nr:hypothetical protein [Carnobacterium maltaromaticum]
MLSDKLVKRKLFLLNLLNESNGTTLREIQLEIGLSKKTIINELDNLLNGCRYSKDEICIERNQLKYYLFKKDGINIEKIKLDIKKESLLFQFYYNFICKIPNQNFYSQSMMYKHLKLLKEQVEGSGIYVLLVSGNYLLKGPETMIRFKAYHYFWETFKGIDNLLCEELKEIEELLYKIEFELGITWSYLNKQQLKLWFWIIKVRIDVREYVKEIEIESNIIHNECIRKYVKEYLFEEKYEDSSELNFLFRILNYFYKMNLIKKCDNEVKFLEYNLVNLYLSEFSSQFDVKPEYQAISALVYEAFYYHEYSDVVLLANSIIEVEPIKVLKKKFSTFFFKFVRDNDFKLSNIGTLYNHLYNICFLIVNTRSYRPVLQILVSNSQGEFHELKMKQKLLKLKFNLKFENYELHKTDFVITDYTIETYEDKFDINWNRNMSEIERELLIIERDKEC